MQEKQIQSNLSSKSKSERITHKLSTYNQI